MNPRWRRYLRFFGPDTRLQSDLRLAMRGFRRTPGFFVTAVTILALGIGMAVAMFTVFRAVLIKRLPVTDQDRIAVMWTYHEPGIELTTDAKSLAIFRREAKTVKDVAAVAHWPAVGDPWLDGDRPISLNRSLVTGNFFTVLGARAVIGRLLTSDDDDTGDFQIDGSRAKKVLVLSYGAWQRYFGGDSSIVGKHLTAAFTRWTYTVVGVAPPGLDYPSGADYWAPLWGGWVSGVQTYAVARLAPGATLDAARAEYTAIQQRVAPTYEIRGAAAHSLPNIVFGDASPVLRTLAAAVALLLLIACLNVGNLLLLRASGRARELAIRRALGASYGDVLRQLVTEAVALAAAGGALGFLVARMSLKAIVFLAPRQIPRMDDVQLAGTPLLLAIGVSSLAVLLFGIVPALFAARGNLAPSLRFDSRSGNETKRRRAARQMLVASQIGLATVMLGGAALLVRSLDRLQREDAGYTSDHLAIMSFTFNAARYDSMTKTLALGDRILARLRATPGVSAATPIYVAPLLGENILRGKFALPGESEADAKVRPWVLMEFITGDFFRVFDIPLVRGRTFTDADDERAERVVIVSEAVARRYWPGQDPIGKRLNNQGTMWTVVGVARDAHLRDIHHATPMIYEPWHQGGFQGSFAIRTSRDLSSVTSALRAAGHDADPQTDLWYLRTMDQLLAEPMAQPRLSAFLMSAFGGTALLLAAIGLYGVMASLVRDQTREIGIRIALGASAARVRREVLSRAAIVTGIGALVGLIAALATSRLLSALLFQVSPTDPLALGGACAVLLAVGAVAAYLPARRATRIDPVQALRAE